MRLYTLYITTPTNCYPLSVRTFNISIPDESLRNAVCDKIDNLNKPKGAMGQLEALAEQICMVQHTLTPELVHPCHLLFGADHGIEREGVSVSPREVTWQQMINFTHGGGGVNMLCRQHGFHLRLIDVGVDFDLSNHPRILNRKIRRGTDNFRYGPAMTTTEFDHAIDIGAEMVDYCRKEGCNILSIGEMGIGNTSPSSIWMHLLGNIPLEECIGAGAGLNAAGVQHKLNVLCEAVKLFKKGERGGERSHPVATEDSTILSSLSQDLSLLSYFGGFEMVAAVGAMLRGAEHSMLILVDGFIMSACMLAAIHLNPAVRHFAVFAHCGDESGHRRLLSLMDARPLLALGMRLGEGTGALAAYPLVDTAVRMINEMNNFNDAHITKYF